MKYNSIVELIGQTPMVRLNKINNPNGASVWVKLEKMNPAGSTKDRAALYMITNAEQEGVLSAGDTIIEPTSGNTGIGLVMVAAVRGYKAIFTMPSSMSIERRTILQAYGAQIILTPAAKGMAGAVDEALRLQRAHGYFMPSQFENRANSESHYQTTAREIAHDLPSVDLFVAGIGTGGTISGVGRYLKEVGTTQVIGVEPEQSKILRGGEYAPHKIQGIGANFTPGIYEPQYVDEIVGAAEHATFETMRALAQREGLFVGISSAAAISIAITRASTMQPNENVVVIAADGGERYLSLDIFQE